ncbi:hypothetical protein MKX03_000726 [Papaver bracteatum]|nr:hypothetical protein MKX03_000726 [Papaver bracteatum]
MKLSNAFTIFLITFSILYSTVAAKYLVVGGDSFWSLNADLENWSRSNTFYVGDTLIFHYESAAHNVLEVNATNHLTCNHKDPISKNEGGLTIITLEHFGTRYFICGKYNHCNEGLRVEINILTLQGEKSYAPPTIHQKIAIVMLSSLIIMFVMFNFI